MTRTEKINKLSNAIKDYRGVFEAQTGKWIRPPQVHKRSAITKWLLALRRSTLSEKSAREQVCADAKAIDGFRTYEEFNHWIAKA